MTYYKWLWAGRRGPYTDFPWPKSGVWVRAEGPLVLCESGCRTSVGRRSQFTKALLAPWRWRC